MVNRFRTRAFVCAGLIALRLAVLPVRAQQSAATEEDRQREAAIAEFTATMKVANYPALFEKAAAEFDVPADVLKGVAFTLTRWEHLTWPPGEAQSPETGKPRPFGIMSLWDNEFFGHSLIDAAKLIGRSPEDLKSDPYQNIRGGAALLKKLYAENAKPEGTTAADIESWRYALTEYVGIPERDLKHRFGLEVYEHMNKGFNQYGIEWPARPVNLGPMREEVTRIRAEEEPKRIAKMKAEGALVDEPPAGAATPGLTAKTDAALTVSTKTPEVELQVMQSPSGPQPAGTPGWYWGLGVFGLLAVVVVIVWQRRSRTAGGKR